MKSSNLRKNAINRAFFRTYLSIKKRPSKLMAFKCLIYSFYLKAACAAASLAIGTRKGEQET